MPRYIVAHTPDSESEEQSPFPSIIDAPDIETAVAQYRLQRASQYALLYEFVTDRAIDIGFCAQFVLTSQDQRRHYQQTGEHPWDPHLIRLRIFDYFDNPDWAQLFADYILSDDEAPPPSFPPAMLAYIWEKTPFGDVSAFLLDQE